MQKTRFGAPQVGKFNFAEIIFFPVKHNFLPTEFSHFRVKNLRAIKIRSFLVPYMYVIHTYMSGLAKVSLAQQPALNSPLRRFQNLPPTKNALKIHNFKGFRKFRLRAAVKLFPGLIYLHNINCHTFLHFFTIATKNIRLYH